MMKVGNTTTVEEQVLQKWFYTDHAFHIRATATCRDSLYKQQRSFARTKCTQATCHLTPPSIPRRIKQRLPQQLLLLPSTTMSGAAPPRSNPIHPQQTTTPLLQTQLACSGSDGLLTQ
jgi:hypothetical protein